MRNLFEQPFKFGIKQPFTTPRSTAGVWTRLAVIPPKKDSTPAEGVRIANFQTNTKYRCRSKGQPACLRRGKSRFALISLSLHRYNSIVVGSGGALGHLIRSWESAFSLRWFLFKGFTKKWRCLVCGDGVILRVVGTKSLLFYRCYVETFEYDSLIFKFVSGYETFMVNVELFAFVQNKKKKTETFGMFSITFSRENNLRFCP